MYKLIVALRYLRRKKLNLFGIAGVAISVMVLIVVLSVMTGFDHEMRSRIRGTLSHLIVEKWGRSDFTGSAEVMATIDRIPHVVACSPHFDGLALVKVGRDYRWGRFRGIDLARECRATDLAEYCRAAVGHEALEECRRLFTQAEAGRVLGTPSEAGDRRQEILAAARRMRRADFMELKRARRGAVREWAAAEGIDLARAWSANERAMPTWERLPQATGIPVIAGVDMLVRGRAMDGRLVSLHPGDKLGLATARAAEGEAPDLWVKTCRVVAKFKSGMYEYDLRNLYMPLDAAQAWLKKPDRVSNINVRLDDYRNAPGVRCSIMGLPTHGELREMADLARPYLKRIGKPEVARAIDEHVAEIGLRQNEWFASGNPMIIELSLALQQALFKHMDSVQAAQTGDPGEGLLRLRAIRRTIEERRRRAPKERFRVSTWEDRRRNILRAVEVERRVMAVILCLTVLVTGFLIFSILHTTVVEKTRDIGILKALGGTVRGIMSIFLLNGFLIGVIGSVFGVVGGVLLCKHLNDVEDLIFWLSQGRLRVFPRDVYAFDRIPTDPDPFWTIVIISCAAILASFVAALYPAHKAARLHAVEAIRYE